MWVIVEKLGPPGLWVTLKENEFFLLQGADRKPSNTGGGVASFLRLTGGGSGRGSGGSSSAHDVGQELVLPSPLFYRIILKGNVNDEELIKELCHNMNLENSFSQAVGDLHNNTSEKEDKKSKKKREKKEKEEKKKKEKEEKRAKKEKEKKAKKGRPTQLQKKRVHSRIVAVSEEKDKIETQWAWLDQNILFFISFFDRTNTSEEEELWYCSSLVFRFRVSFLVLDFRLLFSNPHLQGFFGGQASQRR